MCSRCNLARLKASMTPQRRLKISVIARMGVHMQSMSINESWTKVDRNRRATTQGYNSNKLGNSKHMEVRGQCWIKIWLLASPYNKIICLLSTSNCKWLQMVAVKMINPLSNSKNPNSKSTIMPRLLRTLCKQLPKSEKMGKILLRILWYRNLKRSRPNLWEGMTK